MLHPESTEEFEPLGEIWTMGNRRREGTEQINSHSVFSLMTNTWRVEPFGPPGNPSREGSGVE